MCTSHGHELCVAADAAVMAFCDENSCPREIFDVEEVHGCKVAAKPKASG